MARYRVKDETDLRWNDLRRRATAHVDLEIKKQRELILNRVLGSLWEQYAESLQTGTVIELEAQSEATFVEQIIKETVDIKVEK